MSDQDRREDQRRYESDVWYEVWRNGGNPDAIDPYRVNDRYWDCTDAETCARAELERQRPRHQEEDIEYGNQ